MPTPASRPTFQRVALLLLGAILATAACMPGAGTPPPQPASTSASGPGSSGPVAAAASPSAAPTGTPVRATPRPSTAPPATPPPTTTPAPSATPAEGDTAGPVAEPYDMNLYRKGDFVAQYTFEWCVGASLQMALNMATDESRTSRKDQGALWAMARDRSFSPFGGANPRGWTATLNDLGIGPYELVSIPTLDDALVTAAEAIRATKRPVGLVMWRGRHAWVMSGFESTADPKHFDDFDVTGIRVHDPLYPHGSSVWGSSPKPNALVSPRTLGKQFVRRENAQSRVDLGVASGYLLILPVKAD